MTVAHAYLQNGILICKCTEDKLIYRRHLLAVTKSSVVGWIYHDNQTLPSATSVT